MPLQLNRGVSAGHNSGQGQADRRAKHREQQEEQPGDGEDKMEEDDAEVQDDEGAVDASAGLDTLMAVSHDEGDADKIVAVGQPATLVQQPAPDQQPVDASADRIVYLRSRDLVRLRGAARISQDGSILSGEQIDYLVTQRKVKAAGSADSAGEGRVEVVIPPENLRRSSADD